MSTSLISAVSWSEALSSRKRRLWVSLEAEEVSRGPAAHGRGRSGPSAPIAWRSNLARAVLVVEPDIEQRPAVGRPFEAAIVVGDAGIDDGCRSSASTTLHGAEFRALGVDGIGDEPVVGAVGDIGDAEIGVSRLASALPSIRIRSSPPPRGHAAEQRMLTAVDEARVVGEGPVRRRHRRHRLP